MESGRMTEILTLIKREWVGSVQKDTEKVVFCGVKSVGYREFYSASATEYHPEIVFILADYLDYDGETLAMYNGKLYRIIRSYRTGQEIELTAESAPNEEGEAYVE